MYLYHMYLFLNNEDIRLQINIFEYGLHLTLIIRQLNN